MAEDFIRFQAATLLQDSEKATSILLSLAHDSNVSKHVQIKIAEAFTKRGATDDLVSLRQGRGDLLGYTSHSCQRSWGGLGDSTRCLASR